MLPGAGQPSVGRAPHLKPSIWCQLRIFRDTCARALPASSDHRLACATSSISTRLPLGCCRGSTCQRLPARTFLSFIALPPYSPIPRPWIGNRHNPTTWSPLTQPLHTNAQELSQKVRRQSSPCTSPLSARALLLDLPTLAGGARRGNPPCFPSNHPWWTRRLRALGKHHYNKQQN